MQFVNDDMDELFRKAAENYPLKTDNADWDKVLQGLQKEEDPDEPGNKKTDYRKFLWLLLLLPLAFVCNRYMGNNKDAKHKETVNKVAPTTPTTEDKNGNIIAPGKVTENNSSVAIQPQSENKTIAPVIDDNVVAKGSNTLDERTADRKSTIVNNSSVMLNSGGKGNNATPGNTNTGKDNVVENKQSDNAAGTKDNSSAIKNNEPEVKKDAPAAVSNTPAIDKQESKKDSTVTAVKQAEKSTAKKEKLSMKKGFYASLVGGPDVSTIKLQQVQKVGYSLGLIGGYRITGNFGVELGVLWDKKQYYTDGDQFSTKNIYLPPNVSIKDVTGSCTMIEIPVSARYDFGIKKNSNFFTTLGMSSYLMAKEKYDYMYDHNSNVYGVHREYNSTSKNWFSIVHASVGYEKKIGAIGSLRVEPYLKIPVSGVGIGSLPISSVGVYIGVTKHF